MKKMNSSGRTLVTFLVTIIALSLTYCLIGSLWLPKKDYTKDYITYNKVSQITSTYELMDYCHSHGINYSINDGNFVMEGYQITFSLNNAECAVDNNKHMNYFYLLENGKYDNLITRGDTKANQIKTWGANYELVDGCYIMYNTWPGLIACY